MGDFHARSRPWLGLAVLLFLFPTLLFGQEEASVNADARDKLIKEILTLKTSDYLVPDKEQLRSLEIGAGDYEFEGLAITCPPRLDVGGGALPVLLLSTRRARTALSAYDNFVLLLTPLERGPISLAPYFPRRPPDKNPPPPRPKKPGSKPPEGKGPLSTFAKIVDVKVKLPAVPGRYAIRLLAFDQSSNVFTLDLVQPKDQPPIEWPPHTLDDAQRVHGKGPSAKDDPAELPSFAASDHSPQVEAEAGIALAIPAEIQVDAQGAIYGTVKLVAPASALVQPQFADPEDPPGRSPEGWASVLPRAIFQGTLIFARKDTVNPAQLPLSIPVYAEKPIEEGATVTGHFGLDLNQARPLEPGAYTVWFAVGEHLAGPYPLVISPRAD